jgi:hypothetical protein
MIDGKDDWLALHEKYPHVAFNHRGFDGTLYSPSTGHKILVQCEPWTNMPQNFDLNVLRKFEGIITFNRRFYEMYRHVLNMRWMRGVLACNSEYHLDRWFDYDRRLSGVCCLNNCYHLGTEGDILWMRPEIMNNLSPELVRHVWAPQVRKWGGSLYQGEVQAPIHHSHVNHLKKIAEYRFCACFESTYHPFWSLDFVTERIFNCFKAKTVPIYLGCYNIEDHVPTDLFIDFRKYNGMTRDYDGLNQLLLSFSEAQWEDMTERAYEWKQTHDFGTVEQLSKLIEDF